MIASDELSKCINNYQQVLEILVGEDALQKTIEDQGIMKTKVFYEFLKKKHTYLSSLLKKPIQKMLEMEYYQKLVNQHAANKKLMKLKNTWHTFDPHTPTTMMKPLSDKHQYQPDTQVWHAQEAVDNALSAVYVLELD
ncbi:hypothetical protein C0995_012143 [Termitomyces sp. Mi166|nr:hypothetical protein C0995_012143 [Termitomyces sp. Mi166\